ncbi:hypothetical protein PCO31110_01898 [Pandoraea communis]|uniref:Lipoprotein n=1 Tax=Pandoraea communis TaxID=2508297 RepID=A0A5E4U862_9BURK|nr:hypothetical protein [Pandoraea communis]VVD96230.1 hypothetical protein PCO31110_01898 [Pandoraea communis]
MIKENMCALAFVALGLLSQASKATAFEAWGFVGGNKKEDVLREAKARGDTLDEKPGGVFIHRRDPNTGALDTYHLVFCTTGLSLVSKSLTFTAANYANEQYALVKQYGSPTVTATDQSITNPAGTWEWREIKSIWQGQAEEIRMILTVPTGDSAKLGLVPGMSIVHSNESGCKPHELSRSE